MSVLLVLLEGHSLSCESVFTEAVDKVGQTECSI